ncbi:hypothetical protein D3C73_1427030 [compost metagenome]
MICVTNKLANMATKAVTVTDCPATPSEMPRSCAIGVSKLTGKNSTVIRQATQNATANTADQLGRAFTSARDFCSITSLNFVTCVGLL